MDQYNNSAYFIISPNVTIKPANNGGVKLYNKESEKLIELDKASYDILKLCNGKFCFTDIIDTVSAEYVNIKDLRHDIYNFLNRTITEGFIYKANDASYYQEGALYYELLRGNYGIDINFFETIIDFNDKHILDLGCGTGRLIFYAARKGAKKCIGIDKNFNLLAIAEIKTRCCVQSKLTELSFQYGDIESFNLNKSFDVIFYGYHSILEMTSRKSRINSITCAKNHLSSNGIIVADFFPEGIAPVEMKWNLQDRQAIGNMRIDLYSYYINTGETHRIFWLYRLFNEEKFIEDHITTMQRSNLTKDNLSNDLSNIGLQFEFIEWSNNKLFCIAKKER